MGSLDLGGASSQIAFQVFDDSSGYKSSEMLFNQKYNLFARSYLCYGINEAHRRFLASLVNSAVEVSIIIQCKCTNTVVICEFFIVKKFSFCTKQRKFFTQKLFPSNIIYSEYMLCI